MKRVFFYVIGSIFSVFAIAYSSSIFKDTEEKQIISSKAAESNQHLVCISFLQLSLDQNGLGVLTPDMLLAEDQPNYSIFEVNIVDPPLFTDTADCSLIGETIMVEVMNTTNNQKCWSNVLVEDKLAPTLSCDTFDVDCTFDLFEDDIDLLLPDLEDNCTNRDDLIVTFNQQQITQNCQSDFVLILDRQWYVEDEAGNSRVCNQIIRLNRPNIADVEFPESDTLYCPDFNIDPDQTGFPTLNGEEIGFICGLAAWEEDVIIPKCGNTFKVIRTWNVVDWCANSSRMAVQQIMVLDTVPPEIDCPQDLTISNTPTVCGAEYILPDVSVEDSCANSEDINIVYFYNNTLYNPGDAVFLEIGDNDLEIRATDPCDQTSFCEFTITVNDNESPTVSCVNETISINGSGIANVSSSNFNSINISENCEVEEILLRRMTDSCGRPEDLEPGATIQFCCSDIGQEVMVEVQAVDNSGNIGACMFSVEVQDKLAPDVICPPDLTLNCDELSENSSDYGDVTITDNCSFNVEYTEEIDLDGCKEGEIRRTWVAEDPSGNADSCTQRITVINPYQFDPGSINWPADTVIAACNVDLNDIETTPTFDQTPCETIHVTFNDMTLNLDSTCLDIMRQWEIIDSCTGDVFPHTQMIRIQNNNDPILSVPGDTTLFADTNCQANATLEAASVNDCTSFAEISNSYSSQGAQVDTAFTLGETIIEFTAIDSCGNSSTESTIVTVVDTIPPTVNCPNDTSVVNDPGDCGAFITFPDPDAEDNCNIQDVLVLYTDSSNASGFYPVGETEVIVVVTDGAGLTDTCTYTVEVVDEESPSLTCPTDTQDLFLDEFCQVEVPDVTGLISFEDNCSEIEDIEVVQDPMAGDTLMMVQDTFIQVIISDEAGNMDSCDIQISLRDTLPPEIMCPFLDTLDIFVDADCSYILEDFTSEAMIMSNCTEEMDIEIGQIPEPGTILTGFDTVFFITIQAEDLSGNLMECEFPLQLIDTIDPEIECPQNMVVSTDPGVCEAEVSIDVPVPTDNCEIDSFSNDYTGTEDASGVYPEGTTVVTYTVTDGSGNTDTCSFTVTVEDNEAPELECPAGLDIVLDGNCEAEIPDFRDSIVVSDNCTPNQEIDYSQTPSAGTIFEGEDTITITITVTDNSGRSSICTFDIELLDETAPELTCPDDITVQADEDCIYVVEDFTGQAIVSDNCSNSSEIVVTQDPAPGSEFEGVGVNEITLTATDESGNSTTCVFTVELEDVTDPEIECPQNMVVSTDPGVCEAEVSIDVPVPTDNCEIDSFTNDYTGTEDASGVYPEGTTVVTYTVTDGSGNTDTCSFTVTVEDNEAPELECPDGLDIVLDGNCEAEIPDFRDSIVVSDNCTPNQEIDYSQTPPAGTTFEGVGTITITITVTDNSGRSSICTFDIELIDETAPELTCPDDITVQADEDCIYVVEDFTGQAIVSDNCSNSSEIVVTQDPVPGSEFEGVGVNEITLTATDESGNSTTCVFTVELEDVTDPEIECPQNMVVSADPGVCEAEVSIDVPVPTDNCEIDSFSNDYTGTEDASGVYPEGTTVVTYTVTDGSGNTDTCSFTVTVEDNEAPELECPAGLDIVLDGNCEAEIPDFRDSIVVSDNCTPNQEIDYSQTPSAGTIFEGEDTITITITVTDNSGRSSICTFDIELLDETAPELTCPDDITVQADEDCIYVVEDFTGQAIVSDNCSNSSEIVVTQDPAPGSEFEGVGVNEITLTATDESGNSTTCVFTVELEDVTDPEIECPQNMVVSTDPGVCEAEVSIDVPVPTDNCEIDSFTNDYTGTEDASGVYPEGTTVVTYTVTDGSGNTDTCSFTVTVEDNEAPELSCPPDSIIPLDMDCEALIPDVTPWIDYSDNCTPFGDIVVVQSPPAESLIEGPQDITVTVTVTDSAGNNASCDIVITFTDTLPVEIVCPDDQTEYFDENCEFEIPDYTDSAEVVSSCTNPDSLSITQTPDPFTVIDGSEIGDTIVEITLVVETNGGESDTCMFDLEILDTIPAVLTCAPDTTIFLDENCEALIPDLTPDLSVEDNCISDIGFTAVQDPPAGDIVSGEDTISISFVVTVDNGDTLNCESELIILDSISPMLSCPQVENVTLDVDCEGVIPDFRDVITIEDNCTPEQELSYVQNPSAGDPFSGVGSATVLITITDEAGESATCEVEVNFIDETAPELTCPDDITVQADEDCIYVVEDFTGQAIVSDNCSNSGEIVVTQEPVPGSEFEGVGVNEITITASDESGNSTTCVFTVELEDVTDPEIECPQNMVVSTDPGVCEAEVSIDVPVPTDNCEIDSFTNDYTGTEDASGVYPEGITVVTYTVTDGSGNTDTCSFTVTVEDNEAPELSCPQDSIIPLNMDCEALIPDVTPWIDYSDNCTPFGDIVVVQSPPADSLIDGPQDITVTVTVTDSADNNASCDIVITFTDTLPVEIVCPDDQTEYFDENCEFEIPDYTDSAEVVSSCTDPDSLTITQTPDPFTVIDGSEIGDTIVEITLVVETNGGESDTCMFDLEILDTIPAVLTCAPDTNIFVSADCEAIIPDLTPELSVEDNCISDIGFTAVQDPPAGGILLAGDMVTITYTVTVDNGDVLTCESELTVLDTISPEISCPEDTTLFLNEDCDISIPDFTEDIVLDPGCADSLEIEVEQFPVPGEYPSFSGEEIQIIIVATNPLNNTMDTCEFLVTAMDSIAPILECSGTGITLDLDENCSAVIPDVSGEIVVLEDNCTEQGEIIVTQTPAEGTEIVDPENPEEVEIVVDDGNGNTASCIVIVDFEDNLPPTIICPPDTIVPCQFDIDSTEQFGDPEAFDNCSDVDISFVNQFFSSNSCTVDSLKRVFTATDESGNSASCTQTIIFDGANPDLTEDDFIFMDTVFTSDCEQTDPEDIPGSIPILDPDLEVCKVINTSFEDSAVRDSDFGCKEFDRTWTVIDSCANDENPNDGILIFDQLVVINDTVSPDLTVPFLDTTIIIDTCGIAAEVNFPPATASDCVGIDTLFNDSPFADSNAGGDISGNYEEGIYEILITAVDSCGNEVSQLINLTVSDTSDLELTCTFKVEKPFDTVTLMVPFFTSEMIEGFVNSCGNEPAGTIQFSVDPDDPTDTVLVVTCDDFGPGGTEFVEEVPVYAFIDGELVDSCTTIIAIADNVIGCVIESIMGEVSDVNDEPIKEAEVDLTGSDTSRTETAENGGYEFQDVSRGGFYTISCDYDGDPVAGVSTFDILLIQQHILGIRELDDPYSLIAADVDKNKRITGRDIIYLRRIILGIDREMPVDNWRFIPEAFEFISPEQAHAANYPEKIFIESLIESLADANFIGIKVGDVNGSITPGARGRSGSETWIVRQENENRIDFYVSGTQKVFGFQMKLPIAQWRNAELSDGQIDWNQHEYAFTKAGDVVLSWSDPYGRLLSSDEPLFSVQIEEGNRFDPFELHSKDIIPEMYKDGQPVVNKIHLHWVSDNRDYALYQNRPNPLVDYTVIPFDLPQAEKVEIHIHDNTGRLVHVEKIDGKKGYNEFYLRSDKFQTGGAYHYTLRSQDFIASKLMIVAEQ